MRITRRKLKQEYKSKSVGLTVAFTILLPMLSIYLGYTAFKFFIVPGMQTKEQPQQSSVMPSEQAVVDTQNSSEAIPDEEVTEEAFVTTFELEGLNFYSIQTGKFTTTENAETMKTELNRKGYQGYVYQNDGYKVIAISSLSRTGIEVELQKIRKAYPDAYITSINIPAQQIKYEKDDGKNTLSIETQRDKFMDILLEMSEHGDQMLKENVDAERIRTIANENITALESIKNELNNISTTSSVGELTQKLIKVIDVGLIHLNEAKQSGSNFDYQGALNEILYEYLAFTMNSK
ncbi:SPOR domain-containing protein [Anaerosolibacter sp.]|uniref:SPOR domain-containing protein n=1 Tax=Anaerosolibacter sp. TaxID=1872527 RepID=UPI0039EECCA0